MSRTRRAFLAFLAPLAFIAVVGTGCDGSVRTTCNIYRPHDLDRFVSGSDLGGGWIACRQQHLAGHITFEHCYLVEPDGDVGYFGCGSIVSLADVAELVPAE